jgi:UDP-N-acetylmuramate dehydrogenase
MAESAVAQPLSDFEPILKPNEPLAPYTCLRVGGPAQWLAQPRNGDELAALVQRCVQSRLPLRVLGAGGNLLVHDEGVRGVVVRLSEPAFLQVSVEGRRLRAGAGTSLSALISHAARHSLAGLESLVGTPGTVGGALRYNAGGRAGDIGQYVRQVVVLDATGAEQVRDREELRFGYHWSNLDDPVLLAAELELDADDQGAIVKHLRKAWIQRKQNGPLSFQAAARAFKDPRGLSAANLIQQAGLAGQRVGGAEVSDRDASFLIANTGATARDVLRLLDLVRSRVQERFQVELELALSIW